MNEMQEKAVDQNRAAESGKVIMIQPEEQPNHFLPYPFFVSENGKIGRQDFWKGNPEMLLGLNDEPLAGDITLQRKEFFENPKKAIGKYPVLKNKNGEWVTSTIPIESIKVIERDGQ